MHLTLFRRLKWIHFFRLVILLVILAASLGLEGRFVEAPSHLPPYWTLCAGVFAALVYLLWVRSGARLHALVFLQIFGDILLVTLLVYFTGFDRIFALLYFAVLISAAVLLGSRWAVACASICTILLSIIGVLYFLAFGGGIGTEFVLPGVDPVIGQSYGERFRTMLFGVPYVLFFALSLHVVAVLAGKLAEEASRIRILNDEILLTMDGGVLAVDRNGALAFVNPQAASLLDLRSPRPVGRQYREILPPKFAELITEALRRKEQIHREMSSGDGTPLDVTISMLRDEQARSLRGIVAIVNDLSVRRRLEEAQQRAERFRAMLEMSASMAHEVRNPLASIRGAAQELKTSEPAREEDRRLLQIVMRE
ncbi:MAG: histidine kinase dimerization/phospho-acceptor domain-containing protein, partial [Planctomycetota bacterium]